MEHMENQITIRGALASPPSFSHENHGRQFFRFSLEVPRLSGAVDVLPVVAPEPILEGLEPTVGDSLRIEGQIRSHNIRQEDGRHLQIFVFASLICMDDESPVNDVVLEGTICREPTFRRTPLGREICDVMLAVPRAFHRADYLPCILWGRTAQEAARCHTRDVIQISGRLQSRDYTKQTPGGPENRTAYEISAMTAQIPEDLY